MEWIIFVIIAVISQSTIIFADNYSSDVYFKGSGAASQKIFFAIAQPILSLILLAIFGIDFGATSPLAITLFIFSGFIISISSIFYYRALELDDSTNLGIFIQLAPVLYLIFGWAFLGESISVLQFIAFFVILAAPILIVLTSRKGSRRTKLRAVAFAFLYVLISVIGNLIFVKENSTPLSFGTELALVFIGKGLGNAVIMLFTPKWRRRFRFVMKSSHHKVLRPLTVSFIFNGIKDFAYRFALVSAPSVAIASAASDSSLPIVIFFMGILLTLIWPKFGREKLNRKSIIIHLVATTLVVTGIILMQF